VLDDVDAPVELVNVRSLLHLLESATFDDFMHLLRAPDVINTIQWTRRDGGGDARRRLSKVMKKHFPARPGAPEQRPEDRRDLKTIYRVIELGNDLAPAFAFVEKCRERGGYAADPENVATQLEKLPGVKPSWAKHPARRRTSFPEAVCRIVADETGKKPKAVRRAAERGRNHPDFHLPVPRSQ
jgi:hypothetical protein